MTKCEREEKKIDLPTWYVQLIFLFWGEICLIKVIKKTLSYFSSNAYNVYCVYLEKLGEELEAITVLDWAWNTINENWHEKCLQLLNLLYTRVYNSVQMFEPFPDQNSISLKKSVGVDFSFKSFKNRYVQSLYDQITQEFWLGPVLRQGRVMVLMCLFVCLWVCLSVPPPKKKKAWTFILKYKEPP